MALSIITRTLGRQFANRTFRKTEGPCWLIKFASSALQKELLLLRTPARVPANGGNFKTLFLNGQLHLRSSLGKPLIAPVTLPSGADVQFNAGGPACFKLGA